MKSPAGWPGFLFSSSPIQGNMRYVFSALVVLAVSSCSHDKASKAARQPEPFPAILSKQEVVREIGLYADRNAEELTSKLYPSLVYIEVAQDSVRASITVSSVSTIKFFEYYQPCALKNINNHYVLVKYNHCLNTISPTQRQWVNQHLKDDRPKKILKSNGDTINLETYVLSHPEVLTIFLRDGKIIHKTSQQGG
ncbi:hypothetical protein [Hymenobacter cellulosivorans]|uniref:Lipoprotein n=1 Tax=Hymenobacter cellulosivorans TaxID=2932249 RepID=A0ABY4F6S1_9BACT|nr:hypothetical protein [Hymenobacter cellulosivorans]UOQ51614.1 hypothetical protein MUN80_17845 [Hymenobacter cellulosivorans]